MAQIKTNQYSIADDAITLAKMAGGTDGNIITYDASGNPAVVASGTAGHFLKSQGADTVPVFAAAAGGGKILQVVSSVQAGGTVTNSSSDTWEATGNSGAITPSATSSKILVLSTDYFNILRSTTSNIVRGGIRLVQTISASDTTLTGNHNEGINLEIGSSTWIEYHSRWVINWLDSPSTTSEVTYSTEGNNRYNTNSGELRTNIATNPSSIIMLEIDGT